MGGAGSARDKNGQNDMSSLRPIEHSGTEGLAEHACDNWAGYGIDSTDQRKQKSVAPKVKDSLLRGQPNLPQQFLVGLCCTTRGRVVQFVFGDLRFCSFE